VNLPEMPAGVEMEGVSITFSQENDSCDTNDAGQEIVVRSVDAGAGLYAVIETNRWSLDPEDTVWLAAVVKAVCDRPGGGV